MNSLRVNCESGFSGSSTTFINRLLWYSPAVVTTITKQANKPPPEREREQQRSGSCRNEARVVGVTGAHGRDGSSASAPQSPSIARRVKSFGFLHRLHIELLLNVHTMEDGIDARHCHAPTTNQHI